jgi:hypothetical protein
MGTHGARVEFRHVDTTQQGTRACHHTSSQLGWQGTDPTHALYLVQPLNLAPSPRHMYYVHGEKASSLTAAHVLCARGDKEGKRRAGGHAARMGLMG